MTTIKFESARADYLRQRGYHEQAEEAEKIEQRAAWPQSNANAKEWLDACDDAIIAVELIGYKAPPIK